VNQGRRGGRVPARSQDPSDPEISTERWYAQPIEEPAALLDAVRQPGVQQLDRDAALEQVIDGLIDHAHSPLAEQADKSVTANLVADAHGALRRSQEKQMVCQK
jgi:hypothetical protein